MYFMANFQDTCKTLLPVWFQSLMIYVTLLFLFLQQLNAVISASLSIKNSKKLKRMLEIVLVFGNYMNSRKRGPVMVSKSRV